jgi:hypothetical protein
MHQIDGAPRAGHDTTSDGSVAILAWPADAATAATIERTGQACLLIVAPDGVPPDDWGELTDWVRLPVTDRDLRARLRALRCAARRHALLVEAGDLSG